MPARASEGPDFGPGNPSRSGLEPRASPTARCGEKRLASLARRWHARHRSRFFGRGGFHADHRRRRSAGRNPAFGDPVLRERGSAPPRAAAPQRIPRVRGGRRRLAAVRAAGAGARHDPRRGQAAPPGGARGPTPLPPRPRARSPASARGSPEGPRARAPRPPAAAGAATQAAPKPARRALPVDRARGVGGRPAQKGWRTPNSTCAPARRSARVATSR